MHSVQVDVEIDSSRWGPKEAIILRERLALTLPAEVYSSEMLVRSSRA
jgi:hypothetical protein